MPASPASVSRLVSIYDFSGLKLCGIRTLHTFVASLISKLQIYYIGIRKTDEFLTRNW